MPLQVLDKNEKKVKRIQKNQNATQELQDEVDISLSDLNVYIVMR